MAPIDYYHYHKALVFAVVLITTFNYAYGKNPELCGKGLLTPGYTYPPGDIVLKDGDDLNIFCTLYADDASKYGKNASEFMTIKSGDDTLPTEIINATTIKLTIKNHPKTSKTHYGCYVNEKFVCHNIVIVGLNPQNVTDFDCIGYNIENLTCTWTGPENYVVTSYWLEYRIAARPSRSVAKCPNITVETRNNTNIYSCTWSLSTDPQYRHSHEAYIFNLIANNTFGSNKQSFRFNHFAHVIPDPPKNLKGEATGSDSIKLTWEVPTHMKHFPVPLEHRISYWIPKKRFITIVTAAKTNKKPIVYELTNLPYANYLYDIRVSMRSKAATEERLWSRNSTIYIKTKGRRPDRPPKTNVGSFEYLGGSHIMIYWQKLDELEENGKGFGYEVETEGFPNIKPREAKKANGNYARFEHLPDVNYTFKIYSKNEHGRSSDYSVVSVPSSRRIIKQPENFVKEDKGNAVYELAWVPSIDSRVTNYTIFWCNAPRDRPYQCDGNFNWTTTSKDQSSIILSLDSFSQQNIYQFAISANGHHTSSGMLWAECTVIPGRGIKMRQVYVKNVSSRSIMVAWKLECVKMSDVIGFNITYCPTVPLPESSECLDQSAKHTFINGSTSEEGLIENLTPYTRYKINVKPWLINSDSQFSEAMFNSTFEDIPTQPRNLEIVDVTNSSFSVLWQKPESENGYIRKYEVCVGDLKKELKMDPNDKTDKPYALEFNGLSPSATYNVTVRASTINWSPVALAVASTLIGKPGIVPKPKTTWENSTVVLRWAKPNPENSKVDYYQVWTSTNNKEQQFKHASDVLTNVTSETYNIASCDNTKNVYIRIRAVNILDGKPLEGPWSERADIPCFRPSNTQTWYIAIGLLFVILLIAPVMIYYMKKFYRYIFRMSNIEVKLPTGLSGLVENVQENGKHSDETLHSDEPLLSKKFANDSKSTDLIIGKVDQEVILSTSEIENQCITPSFELEKSLAVDDSLLRQRAKKPSYVTLSDLSTITQNAQQSDAINASNVPTSPNSCLSSLEDPARTPTNRINVNVPSNTSSGYKLLDLFSNVKKQESKSEYKPFSDMINSFSLKPKLPPINLHLSGPKNALRQRVTKSIVKNSDAAAPEIAQTPQTSVSQPPIGYSVVGFLSSPNMENAQSEHIVLSDIKENTS